MNGFKPPAQRKKKHEYRRAVKGANRVQLLIQMQTVNEE
jgi:hypothetical protein